MCELSVVLISRNQEWNIARLIESVLRETAIFTSYEVVLVDSASLDKTAEIAARYPISVIKLHPDQFLSASAGRFMGYRQTTGDLVLFLDGDMEMCSGWLETAMEVMRSQSDIGVVCGRVIDRPLDCQTSSNEYLEASDTDCTGMDVRQSGGAAMYRRSVLERVGTFNPYLYSDEEPELCLRIRHSGFRIHRLSRPIAFHYTAPEDAISTLFGRRSRNLWLGFGQNIRNLAGTPLLIPYLKERGWVMAPALMGLAGLAAIIAILISKQWIWLILWFTMMIILMVGIAIRKKSIKGGIFSVIQRMLILDGTLRGLCMKPKDPLIYPGKYDSIR